MGILDGIVDWLATQIMNLLDLLSSSVLGALGCDMSTFKRYFPAAETMYEIFVWLGVGLLLLNLVWSLFKNYAAGLDVETEDPVPVSLIFTRRNPCDYSKFTASRRKPSCVWLTSFLLVVC